MFDKVLVGYDGTEHSEDALAFALLWARLTGGCAIAACVYWHPLSVGIRRGATGTIDERAERAATVLGQRYGDELEVRAIPDPSPPGALHDLAERERVDLIVVGSTGRGSIGRALGTTADRLLDGAPCPVAVAPSGYRHRDACAIARIGVAFCPTGEALGALDAASSIARLLGASIEVIEAFQGAVVKRVPYGEFGVGEVLINEREAAAGDLDDALRRIDSSVAASAHLLDGAPAEVLIAQAGTLDLLVMGSRAHGPLGRVLLGSVSHEVMLECRAPLVIVPRGVGSRTSDEAVNPAGVHR